MTLYSLGTEDDFNSDNSVTTAPENLSTEMDNLQQLHEAMAALQGQIATLQNNNEALRGQMNDMLINTPNFATANTTNLQAEWVKVLKPDFFHG